MKPHKYQTAKELAIIIGTTALFLFVFGYAAPKILFLIALP